MATHDRGSDGDSECAEAEAISAHCHKDGDFVIDYVGVVDHTLCDIDNIRDAFRGEQAAMDATSATVRTKLTKFRPSTP